jgi:type II secretory pathway component GspD/PulD (secretin)
MTKNAIVILSLTTILVLSNYLIVVAASEESNMLVFQFQGTTVTANFKEVPLKTVFEKIQNETGIWFKFDEFELDERISIQFGHP